MADKTSLELLTFTVGKEIFAIDVDHVQEIIRADYKITQMPHCNRFILGVFQPRDNVISALDLSGYLYNKNNPYKDLLYKTPLSEDEKFILHNKNFIICRENKTVQAWFVDEVHDIFTVAEKDIIPPSKVVTSKNIIGIYNDTENGKLIQIVNFDAILNQNKVKL